MMLRVVSSLCNSILFPACMFLISKSENKFWSNKMIALAVYIGVPISSLSLLINNAIG